MIKDTQKKHTRPSNLKLQVDINEEVLSSILWIDKGKDMELQ